MRVGNQTIHGGRLVKLGTFNMEAGDGWKVRLARSSIGDGLIIADAILILETL